MSEADQGVRAGGAPVTTPGGVSNLPVGALTLDTMAARLQDMSGAAMKERAVERFPAIMDGSTGLSPALDITPFGILTRIFAEANSVVANADPADIQGPDDLPDLLLEFIEGLPVVGKFVELFDAILGDYEGEDEILLAIQTIFAPIRSLIQLVGGTLGGDIPTPEEIIDGFAELVKTVGGLIPGGLIPGLDASKIVTGFFSNGLIPGLGSVIDDIFGKFTGLGGSGWSNGDAADALASQAAITASNAAAITLLQSQINAQGGENTVDATEDFEFSASDLGSNWQRRSVGAGGWYADGHNAVYAVNGFGNTTTYNRFIKPGQLESATDFQIVGYVLESGMQGTDFFFSEAFNDVLLRMNAAMDTMIRVRYGTGNVRIEAIVSDVVTQIGATVGLPTRPAAGSQLFGAAGTVDGIRYYQAIYNQSPVLTVADVGNVGKVGLGFRGWGWGGLATPRGFTQSAPGALRAWSGSDSNAGDGQGGGGGGETTGLYLKESVSRPNVFTTNAGGGLMVKAKSGSPNKLETVSSGGFLLEVNPSKPNRYRTM